MPWPEHPSCPGKSSISHGNLPAGPCGLVMATSHHLCACQGMGRQGWAEAGEEILRGVAWVSQMKSHRKWKGNFSKEQEWSAGLGQGQLWKLMPELPSAWRVARAEDSCTCKALWLAGWERLQRQLSGEASGDLLKRWFTDRSKLSEEALTWLVSVSRLLLITSFYSGSVRRRILSESQMPLCSSCPRPNFLLFFWLVPVINPKNHNIFWQFLNEIEWCRSPSPNQF